jgi:glycosyltransferase involved in cell wall biosynthesis
VKIAYLASAAIPSTSANSLQILKMCEAMAEEGHAVTLFAPGTVDASRGDGDEVGEFYGLRVAQELVRVDAPQLIGRRGLAWRMAGVAQQQHPSLVYTRGVDIALAAAWRGLPVVLELHQLPSGRLGPHYLRFFLHSRGCRRLIIITSRLLELLVAGFPAARRVETLVAGDAYDDAAYRALPEPRDARRALGIAMKGVVAGYFGSVVPGRGVETILAMARALPEVQVMIAGGVERPASEQPANVLWLGRIPPAKVALHQAACDILLMPYQARVTVQGKGDTAEIMSPLKLYEYMAAGRLIISSDLPALRTMLDEGNSLLVPPQDTRAWVAALRRAAHSADLRRTLAHQAQVDVAPHTWRNRARTILADLEGGAR